MIINQVGGSNENSGKKGTIFVESTSIKLGTYYYAVVPHITISTEGALKNNTTVRYSISWGGTSVSNQQGLINCTSVPHIWIINSNPKWVAENDVASWSASYDTPVIYIDNSQPEVDLIYKHTISKSGAAYCRGRPTEPVYNTDYSTYPSSKAVYYTSSLVKCNFTTDIESNIRLTGVCIGSGSDVILPCSLVCSPDGSIIEQPENLNDILSQILTRDHEINFILDSVEII